MEKKYFIYKDMGQGGPERILATRQEAFSQAFRVGKKETETLFKRDGSVRHTIKRLEAEIRVLKGYNSPKLTVGEIQRNLGFARLAKIKGVARTQQLLFKRALRFRTEEI